MNPKNLFLISYFLFLRKNMIPLGVCTLTQKSLVSMCTAIGVEPYSFRNREIGKQCRKHKTGLPSGREKKGHPKVTPEVGYPQ